MPLRLSIVIPVKDDSAALASCLASLASQAAHVFETIVVDNGSSDDSTEVARRFGATVIREDEPGIAAAASRGYDAVSGDIIGRLDADSVPFDDWAEQVVAYFERAPSVSGVTGGAVFTDGPRSLRRVGAAVYLGAYFVAVAGALGHWPLFGSNCAFRTDAWRAVSGRVHRRDVMVHDDMDLSYHLGPVRRIGLSPRIRVGISGRPFWDGRGGLRIRRAFHTILLHWPAELPWRRGWRRLVAHVSRADRADAAGCDLGLPESSPELSER